MPRRKTAGKSAPSVSESYLVEELKAFKVVDGQELVLVSWADFGSQDDTWEPVENLLGGNVDKEINALRKRWQRENERTPTRLTQVEDDEEEDDEEAQEAHPNPDHTTPTARRSANTPEAEPEVPAPAAVSSQCAEKTTEVEVTAVDADAEGSDTIPVNPSEVVTVPDHDNEEEPSAPELAPMVLPEFEPKEKERKPRASPRMSRTPATTASSTPSASVRERRTPRTTSAKRSRVDAPPPTDIPSDSEDPTPPKGRPRRVYRSQSAAPKTAEPKEVQPVLPGYTPHAQEMEEVEIVHIGSAPAKADGHPWALVSYCNKEQAYLPVEFLRQHFPRPLVDYLLRRVRFSSQVAPVAPVSPNE